MDKLSKKLGFTIIRGFRFYHKPAICYVSRLELETLELLATLCYPSVLKRDSEHSGSVRELVRRIELLDCRAVLVKAVELTTLSDVRRIAIWLRGRCGGTSGTVAVARFRNARQYGIRKEVARALYRMSAWSELCEMALTETCPRIKRMALAKPAKPFRNRLQSFSRNVERATRPIGRRKKRRRRDVFVSSDVDFKQGRPPKSIDFIRVILMRLQKLING